MDQYKVPATEGMLAPPSQPWFGGVISALLFFWFAWLFSYCLLDIPVQQDLGTRWNLTVLLVTNLVLFTLMKRYRADLRRYY